MMSHTLYNLIETRQHNLIFFHLTFFDYHEQAIFSGSKSQYFVTYCHWCHISFYSHESKPDNGFAIHA